MARGLKDMEKKGATVKTVVSSVAGTMLTGVLCIISNQAKQTKEIKELLKSLSDQKSKR